MPPLHSSGASPAASRPRAPKVSVPRHDVFLSHAGDDRAWAEHVTRLLERHGLRVFLDVRSIPTGNDYDATIARAVRRSTLMVLLVSASAMRPGSYVRTELKHAEAAWGPTFATRVLCVCLDGSALPDGVGARAIVSPAELGSLPARARQRLRALRRRASAPIVIALVAVALAVGLAAGLESASPTTVQLARREERGDLAASSEQARGDTGETTVVDADPPTPSTTRIERIGLSAGVAVELALVPSGHLHTLQPSPTGRPDDPPQRVDVELPAFWVMTTEVTHGQWGAVMGAPRPRCAQGCDERSPVDYVTHAEALAFANALSERWGLSPCYRIVHGRGQLGDPQCDGVRLPTGAEWEHAARAGSEGPYAFGSDPSEMCTYGNVRDRSRAEAHGADARTLACNDGASSVARVASYRPNAWGLYDVHGNLWEWVADAPHRDRRMVRGGSFVDGDEALRLAHESSQWAHQGTARIGFRLVLPEASGLRVLEGPTP